MAAAYNILYMYIQTYIIIKQVDIVSVNDGICVGV